MSLYLAIDQSTSATKALLYDAEGKTLGSASLEHKQHYPRPGWVEHDLSEIWENTLSVCREVLKECGTDVALAVAITNQRETIAFWDRETGHPLCPAIVWQDRRGVELCEKLIKDGRTDAVRQTTGLPVDAYFSASKIAWSLREISSVKEAAKTGNLCIGTIDTYLVFRLTGGKTFATDCTNASRTLLMNVGSCEWDPGMLQLFGVPPAALPEILSSFSSFGTTRLGGLLEGAVPIMGVMGDSHASLLAHGGVSPGDVKATFGTGTSVMLNIGNSLPETKSDQPVALAWRFGETNTYAFEGLINYSAATLKWLQDQLGILDNAADSGGIAAELSSNEGVYIVPAFSGLNLPVLAPSARAIITGLSARSDKRHLVRAALEAIAYQIADCLDRFEACSGVRVQQLLADGGPTRNAWLMQFCADILEVTMIADRDTALSPRGALYACWIAEGKLDSPESIKSLHKALTPYNPAMDPETAEGYRTGWTKALRQVLAAEAG